MKRYIVCLAGVLSGVLMIDIAARSACGCSSRVNRQRGNVRDEVVDVNPQYKSFVTYLSQSGVFETALRALRTAGLLQTQADDEDLVARLADSFANSHRLHKMTFFVPHDRAFRDLPDYLYNQLFRNPRKLRDVLLYHMVDGAYMTEDLENGVMDTLFGEHVVFERQRNNEIVIDGHARIIQDNIKTKRGVIHTIDAVLLP